MPEVNIVINSREHKISCEAGEEQRVKDLAEMLNKEVINIANNVGQIGDVKLMVLAAITVLDKNQDILDEAADSIESNVKKLEKIFNTLKT
ncbi:MAG: hypothetical protein CMP15_04015 [Rickettsiales bacterium]|nr:hypothetical protein [Pelagibacterales bacterium]MBT35406.1 hypothetical protein [Rickettsiales bacterium]|tara:strand:- start:1459 stop:1731 length:273 start_codon:yes stop_codon:yes gene_type:complete